MNTPCIFCAIVAGEAPASYVYESDAVVAFMDVNPVTPGHLLVVPRAHHASLADLPPPLAAEMMQVGQAMAAALRATDGIRTDGINLFLADGAAAFQSVFHAHLHVIPRFPGDAFRLHIDRSAQPGRAELDDRAARIRSAMT